jgi:hypothetical protein
MIKIPEPDYTTYRQWFERSLDVIWHLSPELRAHGDPMEAIAKAEAISKARAIKSVSAGITDTVAMTQGYSPQEVASADEAFVREGLPSLTAMRALLSKGIAKIFKAGAVANEDEYYALKALEDADIAEATRKEIERLLGGYEAKLAG